MVTTCFRDLANLLQCNCMLFCVADQLFAAHVLAVAAQSSIVLEINYRHAAEP